MDYTWDASIDEETLVKILEDLSCYKFELHGEGVYVSVVEEDGKILYSKKTREELQQEYFCSNNGLREDMGLKMEDRKHEPKAETRCQCQATFCAHVDKITERWYATVFNDNHNHELLGPKFSGMLHRHRRMIQGDVVQMNSMMKAGIAPSHIYASFASRCGGYDKIGFRKADIYNQILQQRRRHTSDAMAALQFLQDLSSEQSPMYFDHTKDQEGRLQHLFWSGGRSQKEYELFGDVLAFDATYGKNKYLLPVVIFSGVNNHNRTTIFATVVVANECEETYVWLLEQFSKVMK
ncbi:MULE transposase domain, partial [Sesbania bispinosa]